jgi:ubiquinone/menaquinone biosynthesis C-methylase UbiE
MKFDQPGTLMEKAIPSMKIKPGRVCPHQAAFLLDNWIRRLLQPPRKILRPFIATGDTAIDLGCGPGFFTLPMARLVGSKGRVLAVDRQSRMLARVSRKAKRQGLADRIVCHQCPPDRIGLSLKADFILAWYMMHETPDPARLLWELRTLLQDGGRLLVVEPKMHVSQAKFAALAEDARTAGWVHLAPFGGIMSRGVLLGFV